MEKEATSHHGNELLYLQIILCANFKRGFQRKIFLKPWMLLIHDSGNQHTILTSLNICSSYFISLI